MTSKVTLRFTLYHHVFGIQEKDVVERQQCYGQQDPLFDPSYNSIIKPPTNMSEASIDLNQATSF